VGRVEDVILRDYEAFQNGNLEGALRGWRASGVLRPLPGGKAYRGRDEVETFLSKDIHELDAFDFRIYTILEQGELALIFGRYSMREEGGEVVDKGIFWIAHLEDEEYLSFEAFENVGEAFAEFRRRLSGLKSL
jgi:hypothetical protein